MWKSARFLLLLIFSDKRLWISMQPVRLHHSVEPLSDGSHYCIYRHLSTNANRARQQVPYCFRPAPSESYSQSNEMCHGTLQTSSNLTPSMLFTTFAPMDIIANNNNQFYCMCSNGSFGNRCEFEFAFPNAKSFDDLVEQTFERKNNSKINELSSDDLTCFQDLENCTTYIGICLDWRQICDGMKDCVGGEDEINCVERELSECNPTTEYRCRSGLCIPRDFLLDLTFDCPDFDDEQKSQDISSDRMFDDDTIEFGCGKSSNAHCEEHACGIGSFSCGDGECLTIDLSGNSNECSSQRNVFLQQLLAPFNLENKTVSCVYSDKLWLDSNMQQEIPGFTPLCSVNQSTLCANRSSSCPHVIYYDLDPFIFPFVRLLFKTPANDKFQQPAFICYDASLCAIPNSGFEEKYVVMHVDGYECYPRSAFPTLEPEPHYTSTMHITSLVLVVLNLFTYCASKSSSAFISQAESKKFYRCKSGQLISAYRVQDGIKDCASLYGLEDEHRQAIDECSSNIVDRYICAPIDGQFEMDAFHPICIGRRWINDGKSVCFQGDDELFFMGCTSDFDCGFLRNIDLHNPAGWIPFQLLCDGVTNGVYAFLEDQNDTDETDCEEWPCNARYQRCDNEWNRPNGCDEINCPNTSTSFYTHNIVGCNSEELYCGKINESALSCLPQQRAGDGVIDCLFGTDERATLLPDYQIGTSTWQAFMGLRGTCWPNDFEEGIYAHQICDGKKDCSYGDDELLCPWFSNSTCDLDHEFPCKGGQCIGAKFRCNGIIECTEGEDEWFCDLKLTLVKSDKIVTTQYIRPLVQPFLSHGYSHRITRGLKSEDHHLLFWCHRGILIRSRDFDNVDRCLCPPSYYGNRCQFQRRRLTVSFASEILQTFDTRIILHLIFSLLDEHSNVLVQEQLIYMPNIQSSQKYLLYLVYPHQALFKKLFLRVDSYRVTKDTLDFFLAWHFPVQFAFLPVNRLAIKLLIDEDYVNRMSCHALSCRQGTCRSYANSDAHFCQCHRGWTGLFCDIVQKSNCTHPVSIGNHTQCLCPLGRLGSQCETTFDTCQGIQCQNHGSCVPFDDRTHPYVCVCTDDRYHGDKCQFTTASISLRIPSQYPFIPMMNMHFLLTSAAVPGTFVHRNTFAYRNVWPNTQIEVFERNEKYLPVVILAQLFFDPKSYYGSYYLVALIEGNRSLLHTTLSPSYYCPHVSERLDPTILAYPWLRRVKIYHKFFRDVKCFYDEIYMCLVDDQGMPDCMNFNHGINNCSSSVYCENGGRCLQSKRLGRSTFSCVCRECFYGSFCQLTISAYSLTLDSIIGAEIVSDISLVNQPISIKIFITLAVLILIIGLTSNLCSALTFSSKTIRQYGCGCYLLILSIVSQITLCVFFARFVYLLVTQIGIVYNEFSCMFFDFLLYLLLAFCDWLTACVACERTVSVLKGTSFDKKKSVKVVKFVVPSIFMILILTSVHQVFNRTLISDPRSDTRQWCVIRYRQPWLQTYEIVFNLFNNIIPFLFNFISAIVLLISFSRSKRVVGKEKYRTILKKNIRQHKDLLISPIIMVAFKLPELVVILALKCIKARWQLYTAAITYYCALIPIACTFLIFVSPASSYMKEFNDKRKKLFKR